MAKQPRVWTGTQWDTLAVTLPDLSNYSTTTQMNTAIGSNAGLNLINTTTVSAASSVVISNVFSSTYNNYFISFSGTLSSTSAANLQFDMANSGTRANISSWYGMLQYSSNGSVGVTGQLVNGTSVNAIVGGNQVTNGHIYVYSPFLSVQTSIFSDSVETSTADTFRQSANVNHLSSTSYNGFFIAPTTGTMTGTFRVYGYRNS